MAARRPLVIDTAGVTKELPSGDSVISDGVLGIGFSFGSSANVAVLAVGEYNAIWIPYGVTFTNWNIFSSVSGSIVLDVWIDSYTNLPPTVADTIVSSGKPTLSSAIKAQGSASGWTVSGPLAIAAAGGFMMYIRIDSVTTCTYCFGTIEYKRIT